MSPGSGRIWALVDSNQDLAKPTGVFSTGRVFFVIQAASPRPQRVQWLERVDSQYFYMKGWSLSEVLQAYVGLPHGHSQCSDVYSRSFFGHSAPYTEQQLYELHWAYAASPRAMARYAGNRADYIRELTRQARLTTVEGLIPATKSPYFDGCFDPLVIMEPSPTSRADWVKMTTPAKFTLDIFMSSYFPPLPSSSDPRFRDLIHSPR